MPIACRSAIAVTVLLTAGLCAPAAFAHSSFGGHGGSSGGHGGSFGGHGGGSMAGHSFAGHPGGTHIATQHFTPRAFSAPHVTAYAPIAHAPVTHWSAPAGHAAVPSGYGHSYAPAGHGDGHGGSYGQNGYAHNGYGQNGYAHNGYGQNGYAHSGYGQNGYARAGWRGGYYSHGHAHWGGGYWGGRWWPGVHYGVGFAWFLPVLPLYCPVFWWDSMPYYYYNDAYYTWSPTAEGYVATDPPPAATSVPSNDAPADVSGSGAAGYDASGDDAGGYNADGYNAASAPAPTAAAPIAPGYPPSPPPASGSANVYAYPSNGQTADQQASDRRECEQWAGTQAGGSGSADYRRAVIACFQGRGYSAQ